MIILILPFSHITKGKVLTGEKYDGSASENVGKLETALAAAENILENVLKVIKSANLTTDSTLKQLKKWENVKGERHERDSETDRVILSMTKKWIWIVDRTRSKVLEAQNYLDTAGVESWSAAEKVSAAMGNVSTNLGHLAAEARLLAQRLDKLSRRFFHFFDVHYCRSEKEAGEMENFASLALVTSKKALQEADAAVSGGEQENREIDDIRQRYCESQ